MISTFRSKAKFFQFTHRHSRREALRVAVSEKDAQLALLELSGVKTTAETSKVETVRLDRKKLLGKLKEEVL